MIDKTVVIGTIGSDCHVVGNWIVARSLEQSGFRVVQLGACVSQEEFIDAAIEAKADAIFVSSLYGMGIFDCEGLREKCIETGLKDILLYIGGYLTTTKQEWQDIEKQFKDIGFDRVYPPETKPALAIADLKRDLGLS